MVKRRAERIYRKLSAHEQGHLQELRKKVDAEKDELLALGRQYKAEQDADSALLAEAAQLLKAERVRQRLSLADVKERSGIDRPNLSRLENAVEANPTVATLSRYANALGKRLRITLEDQ